MSLEPPLHGWTVGRDQDPVADGDVEFRCVTAEHNGIPAALMRNLDAATVHVNNTCRVQAGLGLEPGLEERSPAEAL